MSRYGLDNKRITFKVNGNYKIQIPGMGKTKIKKLLYKQL